MKLEEKLNLAIGPETALKVAAAAKEAVGSNRPVATPFMAQNEVKASKAALDEEADISYRSYGGYKGSERARLALAPAGFDFEGYDPGISCMVVMTQSALPDEMSPYLKAAGLSEGETGDVFVTEGGIGVVATADAVTRAIKRGVDVQGAPCEAFLADPFEISFPGQAARDIKATVSSLRLDAVAACGFPASRTRLAQEIELGRAKVNGRTVIDASARVRQGDVIVFRGRGRLVVAEEGPVTKKGRIALKLKKYSLL